MINVSIICVGRLKEDYLRNGCAEYLKRLGAYSKVSVIEVSEERCGDSPSPAEIKNVIDKEGKRIISKIPKGSIVIPLCIEGKEFTSFDFSRELEKISLDYSSIAFVIGGSFGLSEEVKSLGKIRLSFGKMTLPHQLARLVLLEQLYRAFSISNNSKYHK